MAAEFSSDSTCLHLRCKQMFYKDPADGPDEDERPRTSSSDTTAYWCQCTQTGRGPDEQRVGREECCSSRTCFVSVTSLT